MTLQRLLTLVFRDINVCYPGQTPSPDQLNEGLDTINELLGNWSHEGLLVPTHAVSSFALSAGTTGYTLGVGGNWVTTALAIKVKGATSSLTNFQSGVAVMPMGDFESSIVNGAGITAALPSKMGVDNSAPLRNVRVWPIPNNSSAVVEVSYWMPLTAFSALSDNVAFALPAFELAIRDELANRLAVSFSKALTPDMIQKATVSKAALARIDPAEPPAQAAPVAK